MFERPHHGGSRLAVADAINRLCTAPTSQRMFERNRSGTAAESGSQSRSGPRTLSANCMAEPRCDISVILAVISFSPCAIQICKTHTLCTIGFSGLCSLTFSPSSCIWKLAVLPFALGGEKWQCGGRQDPQDHDDDITILLPGPCRRGAADQFLLAITYTASKAMAAAKEGRQPNITGPHHNIYPPRHPEEPFLALSRCAHLDDERILLLKTWRKFPTHQSRQSLLGPKASCRSSRCYRQNDTRATQGRLGHHQGNVAISLAKGQLRY